MIRISSAGLLVLLGALLLGCDTTATRPESQLVVESYLEAEAPLPTVRLSRTVGVDEAYDPTEDAVRGADVVVARLADDSTVAEAVPYSERDSVPGLYAPDDPSFVEPETTYRLRVETGDGAPLTATTTVPDAITVVGSSNDTTTYQSPRQPAFTIEPPRALTDRQNVYTFTATSLLDFERTPDSVLTAALTPFYADGFDAEDDSLASLRITSSGLLNEGNFTRNADGTITVRLPWIAVAFYGPNEVAVNVVDDNFYDLLRSQQVQQGGFSPGEIPNVIEHVEGGTGIFGSYARAARAFVIRPPDSLGAVRPSAGP
jgi:hypothetical protein